MKVQNHVVSGACALMLACFGSGCGSESADVEERFEAEAIPRRPVTIIAESCGLEAFQESALQSPALRQLSREVILLCPVVRVTGEVSPVDPAAREKLAGTVQRIRALGYKTRLGITMGDDLELFPFPYDAERSKAALADPAWRAKVVSGLGAFADISDGLELNFYGLADASRGDVTKLFVALGAAYRPRVAIGLMAPPSTREPSDTDGGNVFDLTAIAPNVDRIRMMTLDYSCCGQGPGTTYDGGWAVDVARFAKSKVGAVPVDVAFPLYGMDYSDLGDRFVNYTDGRALADVFGVTPSRSPSGELFFDWRDDTGRAHQTWYPDAVMTSRVMRAWNPSTLPPDVGVAFYGLGSEDPTLWSTIARGMQ